MTKYIALYYNYKGNFIIKPYEKSYIQGYYLLYISHNYCKVVEYMEQIKSIHKYKESKLKWKNII